MVALRCLRSLTSVDECKIKVPTPVLKLVKEIDLSIFASLASVQVRIWEGGKCS